MGNLRGLKRLGFLHIVPFERDNPADGLNRAIELFSFAESLGFDSGWIRTRHLQYGVSSPAVFLTAVAQRTHTIDLGTAVIPLAYESPLRLAEDLATADILSGGRLQPGFSVGPPKHPDAIAEAVLGEGWKNADHSYAKLEKTLGFIAGQPVDSAEREIGLGGVTEMSSDRVEPYSPGLRERTWYGAGSLKSARWAAEQEMNLLVSNVTTAVDVEDFNEAQRAQILTYRGAHPSPERARVAQGHVWIPTDNTTPTQRTLFEEYVHARTARTKSREPGALRIAADNMGSTAQIVETALNDVAFQAVDEFLVELPFQFSTEDCQHILYEAATNIAPALGWSRV